MSAKYDIILPTYGQPDAVKRCIGSLYEFGDPNLQLIWIENPKYDPLGRSSRYTSFSLPWNTIVMPHENIGYTKAINAGLALSTAPYVVLLNSDTVIETPGWLDKMAAAFEQIPRLAAVCPATDNTSGDATRHERGTGVHLVQPEVQPGWGLAVKLTFFCIMLCREAIEDIGYLDDRFSPGCGEDDDWLTRAYQKGWKTAVQSDVFVRHVGHASWDMELRAECQKKAIALLKKKYPSYHGANPWMDDPLQIGHSLREIRERTAK